MSYKTKIIDGLCGLAQARLKYFPPEHLTILTYHSVRPLEANYLLDDDVISTSPTAFEEEIRFFKEYFQLITFRDLSKYQSNGKKFPKALLIVTFDDGYRDNYTHVFPILKKYRVPATIFLSVAHVESGASFWWNETVYYLKVLGKSTTEIKQFLRELKSVSNPERIARIKELSKKIIDKTILSERQSLFWQEIEEMHKEGIEFGSHTLTHPILSQLTTDQELDFEIKESKRMIEEKLKTPVTAFSYPIGGRGAFNQKVKDKVKEAGYEFAVTYVHGVNRLRDPQLDYFELSRVDMDKENLSKIKSKLAWPKLFER